MKISAVLFVCLALTEFSQKAPEKEKVEWSPWIYVETRNEVELYWRRCPNPAEPKIQFGLNNKNDHKVVVRFLEQSYRHGDGSYEPRPPSDITIPAQENLGKKPETLKRMPKSWDLRWEVRKAG